ncbi:MAG TPA: polyprenol monophosphomannose synthase [Vicinamibacterales bacterium]|jgi:dolichol-phosphate mannosyltransferase
MFVSGAGRPALTMVVPTYNERDRIAALVDQLFAACDGHVAVEVIVVDDNSPDGTGEWAETLAATRSLRVIHRRGKLGLGSAVLEGFAAASADVVGAIDADLSHPPRLVPALFSAMSEGDLDMVVASRYIDGGGSEGFAFGRRLMSRTACLLSRSVTPVRDAMSGFFLIRRRCLEELEASTLGFKVGLELLVRARLRRVGEIPYTFVGRTTGESKMSAGEGMIFLRQLAAFFLRTPRRDAPLAYQALPAASPRAGRTLDNVSVP